MLSNAPATDKVDAALNARAGRAAGRRMLTYGFTLAIAAVAALLLPWTRLGTAADVVSYTVAVLGVNLVVGYSGQISLGHAAFLGVGAYTAVILSADYGWPLVWTVIPAAAVGFVIGSLIGVPALRLQGLYLALLTLGFGASFGAFIKRLDRLTNGTNGKSTDDEVLAPHWFGSSRAADAQWRFFVTLAVAVAIYVLVGRVVRGRVGRAIAASRDNELSARTFGVNVNALRVVLFGLSAAVTAAAGALFMYQRRFATETPYSLQLSIILYTAAFVGGTGTLAGSVVGGLVIVALPMALEQIGLSLEPTLVYGAALVVLNLFAPDGVVGGLRQLSAAGVRRWHGYRDVRRSGAAMSKGGS